jgi:hypothetical protein
MQIWPEPAAISFIKTKIAQNQSFRALFILCRIEAIPSSIKRINHKSGTKEQARQPFNRCSLILLYGPISGICQPKPAQTPKSGTGRGTRTHGLRFWRPSLYQLSYTRILRLLMPKTLKCKSIPDQTIPKESIPVNPWRTNPPQKLIVIG